MSNYFLKIHLLLVMKYLIIKFERLMCIEYCYNVTFSSLIETPCVLLLDGMRSGRLGEIFSKQKLGDLWKRKVREVWELVRHVP